MSFITKMFKKTGDDTQEFSYDQAVVVKIETQGYSNIYEEIKKIESKAQSILPDNSGCDGDEFGDDEAVIYFYGPEADNIFAAILPVFEASVFKDIEFNLQYGEPDDPSTKEKTVSI